MIPQSRARFVGLFPVLAACCIALALPACSPPTAPYQGQVVTEEEMPGVIEAALAKAETERRTKVEAAAAEARGESDRLARDAASRQAGFEIAVSKLDAHHAIGLAELRAEYEATRAEIASGLEAVNARTLAAIEAANAEAVATATKAKRDHAAWQAAIDRQWDARQGWATGLTQGLNAAGTLFPAAAPFVGMAVGAVGLFGWRRGVKKAEAATEAVRAVTAGVASLPEAMRNKAKAAIGLQADASDRAIIREVVAKDELLSVEKAVDEAAEVK